jgi:hypothetical protein
MECLAGSQLIFLGIFKGKSNHATVSSPGAPQDAPPSSVDRPYSGFLAREPGPPAVRLEGHWSAIRCRAEGPPVPLGAPPINDPAPWDGAMPVGAYSYTFTCN